MMEQNTDKITDSASDDLSSEADRQIQSKLYEQAQSYAETRVESKKLNDKRATSRKKVVEMGFRSDAYQTGIRIIKDLSARERADFMRDLNLIIKVLGKRQAELFPEEALKAAKREEERKAENKPKTKAEADAKSDSSPRSNPTKGGAAGAVTAFPSTPVDDQAINDKLEQEEGAKVLDRRPQSEIAAEKRAAIGLN